jgi:hypothetical protein
VIVNAPRRRRSAAPAGFSDERLLRPGGGIHPVVSAIGYENDHPLDDVGRAPRRRMPQTGGARRLSSARRRAALRSA